MGTNESFVEEMGSSEDLSDDMETTYDITSEEDPVEPQSALFTHKKVLSLERLFMDNICFPTPQQIERWSRELSLKQSDVRGWFKRKWKAKLDYEATIAMNDSKNNDSDDTLAAASGRPMQKFEIDSSHNSPVGLHNRMGDYVIDYDNADDDDIDDDYMNIECEAIIDE